MTDQHPSPCYEEVAEQFRALLKVTERVNNECVWTKVQQPEQHLAHIQSELEEISVELTKVDTVPEARQLLEEELGDLLFASMLLISSCVRTKQVSFEGAVKSITDKVIRRCPHVFGDEKADSPEEASNLWKREKAKESC